MHSKQSSTKITLIFNNPNLPCTPTIRTILLNFSKTHHDQESKNVVSDIIILFNVCVGLQLLYVQERKQYEDELAKQIPLCDIYGAVHLLRLIVKFPFFMQKSNLPDESVQKIKAVMNALISFMEKHTNVLFNDVYNESEI
eukprot:TRINITY_DN20162_c0_g1_i3.p1 TRINITY_DN20162_c0_g1~~TRINITY_DN20162_c0_g1_i3.p1  ORF type:complete len:141 (+),score=26.87 TRINITY_DN20162_c0_g1_i3:70-492(+)